MENTLIIYLIISAILIVYTAWLSARSKKLHRALLWVLVASFIPILITFIISPSKVKTELYWYWDIPSFLIKSLSMVTFTSILLLGSSLSSWVVSVRWNKPMWLSIVIGIVAAIVLFVPSFFISLILACTTGDC